MDPRLTYLFAYVAIQWLFVTGLLTDVLLKLTGHQPISHFARQHWWLGATIILLHCIAPVALALHFWGPQSWLNQ